MKENMAKLLFRAIFLCYLLHILKQAYGEDDTLHQNQTMKIGENLVSENKVYVLGFFRPGKSRNVFLGIWYRATPDAVVWVANRDNPIIDSEEAVLAISINGSLSITKGGSLIIWLETPSVVATSRPTARLLDSGNMVVVDETREGEDYLWQSSDFPTDTLLPDMKMVDDPEAGVVRNLTSWRNADDPSPGEFVMRIENRGVPEIVILRGAAKWFRTGNWNGLHFNGIPRYVNTVSAEPGLVFPEERLISMSRAYKSSIVIRATLGVSGSVQQYTMNAKRDRWNVVDSFPRDQCDRYGHCGPNAVCKVERAKKCECFKGFIPRFPHDWEVQDWGGGCRRHVALDCEGEHGFLEVRRVKYPDMLEFWLNSSMSLHECRAQCLRNCSCNAYANPYVTNGGRGCVLWFGDLVDTRGLSAANTLQNIYIRLPLHELGKSLTTDLVRFLQSSFLTFFCNFLCLFWITIITTHMKIPKCIIYAIE